MASCCGKANSYSFSMEGRRSGRVVHDVYGTSDRVDDSLLLNLHNDDLTFTLCKWSQSSASHQAEECQTRQCWSNVKQDSVTALSASCLKSFQKLILRYCLAVIQECGQAAILRPNSQLRHPPAGGKAHLFVQFRLIWNQYKTT